MSTTETNDDFAREVAEKAAAKAKRDAARAAKAPAAKPTKKAKVEKKPAKAAPKKASKAVVVIDKKADQVAEKAAKVTEAQRKLEPIAKEINVRFEKIAKLEGDANDHRLSAALQMARAEQIAQAAGLKFKDWAADNIKTQSWETVRKLLYVGKADEPAKALADLRAGTKKAQAKHREKVKIERKQIAAPKPVDVVAGLKPEDQVALVKKVSKDLGLAVVSATDAKALEQFRKDPPKKAEAPAAAAAPAEAVPFGYDAIVKAVGDLKGSEKLKLLRWLAEVVGYDVTAKTEATKDADLEVPDFLKR
jgi:hypothetical protein